MCRRSRAELTRPRPSDSFSRDPRDPVVRREPGPMRSFELRSLALLCALAVVAGAAGAARGQIVTDGTVGPATTLVGPNFAITHDLGQIRGKNLFHSFQTFNINPGETA